MWYRKSKSQKLIIGCLGCIAALFLMYGIWQVQTVRATTEARVATDITNLVALKANQIQGFFDAKGQVIHTAFANPQVLNWFRDYRDRGGDLSDDPAYPLVKNYFRFLSDNDTAIKSMFFGSANTYEYFDLNGRFEGDSNYYTRWVRKLCWSAIFTLFWVIYFTKIPKIRCWIVIVLGNAIKFELIINRIVDVWAINAADKYTHKKLN